MRREMLVNKEQNMSKRDGIKNFSNKRSYFIINVQGIS